MGTAGGLIDVDRLRHRLTERANESHPTSLPCVGIGPGPAQAADDPNRKRQGVLTGFQLSAGGGSDGRRRVSVAPPGRLGVPTLSAAVVELTMTVQGATESHTLTL